MRAPSVLILSLFTLLGTAAFLGSARERGYSAGLGGDLQFAVRDVGALEPRTPWARSAAAEARPLRDPRGSDLGDAPRNARADALYLASVLAPSELKILRPPEALVRIELPDGRKFVMTCPPGQAAKNCVQRVAEALDPRPPTATVVEAEARDGTP